MKRGGYKRSRAFQVDAATKKSYLLDQIPPGLWVSVGAKARRENRSVRDVILHLVSAWVAGEIELPNNATK